ncbi:MAG TPA: hypothetical protein VLE54_01210 [Thermoanaerobaculia bacterium]|nr:hypothetical protein [Thermoanaerobaculia bacterium]
MREGFRALERVEDVFFELEDVFSETLLRQELHVELRVGDARRKRLPAMVRDLG